MIYDIKQLKQDYALCYSDKSRIRFIEAYLSTFNATKGKKTQFHCFPRQRAFLKALSENRNVVAIKPRQCGITTLSSAWVTAQCVFASKDAPETVLCIANKLEQAQEIIIKIRDFLEQVPRWMWGSEFFSVDPNSEKNTKSIFLKDAKGELKLFNGCRVIARASGPNASRGISAVSCLILDEAAFIEDGVAAFTTAAATMASNPNSKTVMVSTPNGRDELYYNTYRQALAHENNFVAVQFRWYQDPRFNKYLVWKKKNEETGEWDYDEDQIVDDEGGVKYDEERWAKLEHEGWKPDSPWYQEMCKSFNNDSIKIAQELDVSFMGSADNVVAPEFIEMQEKLNVREPLDDFADPLVEETWFWKKPIDGHRYILACLPEGEKVMTQRGLVNVEDVEEDDLLVTKDGEYTKIKTRMVREVEDEEVVEIKPHNFIDSTMFTWNHPIWSSISSNSKRVYDGNKYIGYSFNHNFEFEDASKVEKDSFLEIPNVYRINKLSIDLLVNKWDEFKMNGDDNDCPLYDEDFWWYCGMWLAEGYCKSNTNRIVTSHNINEVEYHEKIKSIARRLFKRNANTYIKKDCPNGTDVYFEYKTLYDFLSNTFGKYAYGKHIPEWVKILPDRFKMQLFYGYWQGDGWTYDDIMFASSASKKLINDFQDILLSLGIVCSVKIGKKERTAIFPNDKISHCRESYEIRLNKTSTKTFYKLLNANEYYYDGTKKYLYFSDDLKYIYVRIAKVSTYKYSGLVYNFETESDSHTFCCRGIATHNCDPSRGTSADRTAIEVIDMDGRDENGMPIIEQVAEYIGKKLGDDIGALCYQYATMYNEAFIVIDATGGSGDAAILTLLNMGYKNLYYEDMNQKMYMVQRSTKNYDGYTDKLPGFHFQGNRYPVLANFAGLVRNNEFKIRSARVINELETWIFKGDNARMDHQEGAHDDSICALAMGLFVMQYTVNRIQNTQNKDKAILNAYMMGAAMSMNKPKMKSGDMITPKNGLPFYTQRSFPKNNVINGTHMWVFGQWR